MRQAVYHISLASMLAFTACHIAGSETRDTANRNRSLGLGNQIQFFYDKNIVTFILKGHFIICKIYSAVVQNLLIKVDQVTSLKP